MKALFLSQQALFKPASYKKLFSNLESKDKHGNYAFNTKIFCITFETTVNMLLVF